MCSATKCFLEAKGSCCFDNTKSEDPLLLTNPSSLKQSTYEVLNFEMSLTDTLSSHPETESTALGFWTALSGLPVGSWLAWLGTANGFINLMYNLMYMNTFMDEPQPVCMYLQWYVGM